MRTLFATDGSPSSDVALEFLCSLPRREGDHVEVLSVAVHHYGALGVGDAGVYVAELVREENEEAAAIASATAARLCACGIEAVARTDEGSAPAAVIANAAATASDLIVVGSRGRGLIAGTLLGSTARALARHSPIPVLVVRDRREAPRRVLVAVDGSPDSHSALTAFAAMPRPRATEVVLLYVVSDRGGRTPAGDGGADDERRDRERALQVLERATALLPPSFSARFEIAHGAVADRVLSTASAVGADLIVLGSRGTELGAGFLQGSTADRVLSGAHCAVLVARAAERVRSEERVRRLAPALAARAV